MTDLDTVAATLMEMAEPCVVLLDDAGNGLVVNLDGRHPLDILAALSPETGAALDVVGMLVHGTAVHETPEGDVTDAGRVVAAYVVSRDDAAGIVLLPSGVQTDNAVGGAIPDAVRAFLG